MSSPAQIWAHRTLIANLVRRDLRSRHKRSLLGWGWSLINPLATLGLYSLVFGVILRAEPPVAGNGTLQSFPLYLFCGLVVWNSFLNTYNNALASLEEAGPLLTKVYFPPECPPIAGAIGVLNQTALESLVLVAVLIAAGNFSWTVVVAPFAILSASLFGLGLGMVAGLLNIQYRDVGYLSAIALQMLFYGTPIIYPMSLVPDEVWGLPVKTLIELNPLTQMVAIFRDTLYLLELPSFGSMLYASLWAIGAVCLGWWTYAVRAPRMIEEL